MNKVQNRKILGLFSILSFGCSIVLVDRPAVATMNCFTFLDRPTCVVIDARTGEGAFTWKLPTWPEWRPWRGLGGRFSSALSCAPNNGGFECFGRGDNGNLFMQSYWEIAGTVSGGFRPSSTGWWDLGKPVIDSMSTRGSVVNDPSCVRVNNVVTCFMNAEGSAFSSISKNANPSVISPFEPWQWLGTPALISSPSCFARPRAGVVPTIVCVGARESEIAVRNFTDAGVADGPWTFTLLSSFGLSGTIAANTHPRCAVARNGDFACIFSRRDATSRYLIEFPSTTGSSPRASELSEPRNVDECFYETSGLLSCVAGSTGQAYTRQASGDWLSLLSMGDLSPGLGIQRCTLVSSSDTTLCMGTKKSDYNVALGTFPVANFSVLANSMGTWSSLTSRPASFPVCDPAMLQYSPLTRGCRVVTTDTLLRRLELSISTGRRPLLGMIPVNADVVLRDGRRFTVAINPAMRGLPSRSSDRFLIDLGSDIPASNFTLGRLIIRADYSRLPFGGGTWDVDELRLVGFSAGGGRYRTMAERGYIEEIEGFINRREPEVTLLIR